MLARPVEAAGPNLTEAVRGIPVFTPLPPDEHWLLAHTGRLEKYQRGTLLFRAGAPATEVFALLHGAAKLLQSNDDVPPFVVRIIGPFTVFGIDTIAKRATYSVTAEVLSPGGILVWRGATIARMMRDHPEFSATLMGIFTARLQDLRTRYRELATSPVGTRLARTLVRLRDSFAPSPTAEDTTLRQGTGSVDLPLSRRDLAQLVGTTIYTVSRTLQRWEDSGLVHCGRMHVTVVDRVGLQSQAT